MGSQKHTRMHLPDPVPLPPLPAAAAAPVPPARPPLALGLTVHDLSPLHLALLPHLGVTQVRTTLYWSEWDHDDPTRAGTYRFVASVGIQRALDAGVDLLICAHGAPGRYGDHWRNRDRLLADYTDWLIARAEAWPQIAWQPWNEPDADTWTNLFLGPGVTPDRAGLLYGAHLADLIETMPGGTRIVAAGLGARLDTGFLDGMLDGVDDAHPAAFAVHCYGPPPASALAERVAVVRAKLRDRTRVTPVWVTEFGVSDREMRGVWQVPDAYLDDRQAAEWASTAIEASRLGVERAYGFCLDASDPSGYGILRSDGAWRTAAQYLAKQQGGSV